MAAGRGGRTVYKSMQGKSIDMDLLRKKNEMTPAVGNARVNARGDILGAGGKIVKTREEVAKEYYKTRPVHDEKPVAKAREEVVVAEAPVVETKTTSKTTTRAQKKVEKAAEPTASELAAFDDMDDGWTEDANGNFVKK